MARIIVVLALVLVFSFALVSATSHYSFQHAEELKPLIKWRDYSPDAFAEAAKENKPIFLLLTAPSWCYWCQVYESEDYLFNPKIVDYINENFIPIYVDADKRQDLTRQYLEGGWPSTTILTPSGERIFGYSGVRPVENMLENLKRARAFVSQKSFSNSLKKNYIKVKERIPTKQELENLQSVYTQIILQAFDKSYGGFGTGQKFPQGRTLDFSLQLYEKTRDKTFLDIVEKTLEGQYTSPNELETNYNLFDPIEGGFHRYGTQRDWTPPHYEKMLYDNARLLRTYFHLMSLQPQNNLAREVVEKTDSYIQKNWYDSLNGGFYGNTDVHGEDSYYAKNPRPADKPRVEKTKYSDWNAEAVLTYLYLYEKTRNNTYKEIAEKSLDFFKNEMLSDQGAYHYFKNGEKKVRGNLLDNSYLLLAFTQGYETLKNPSYLEAAKKLADYSLNNLYDWNSGGFFERNSPDKELYAPGENILLEKPSEENGIMTFALLKLYEKTDDLRYLNAALKTFGNKINEVGSLDRGYYFIKSAEFILNNSLLDKYSQNKEKIENLEKEQKEKFWLNDFLKNEGEFKLTSSESEKFNAPAIVLIIVSLFLGFLSFASPCTLPILPAYLAHSLKSSRKNIFAMSLLFFLGIALFYTFLGMSASFIGSFLKSNLTIFTQISGIVIMLLGILMLLGKSFPTLNVKTKKPASYISSFLFGAVIGLAWTPCTGPLLLGAFILASNSSSLFLGGAMLFSYSVGLSIPLLAISLYLKKSKNSKIMKIMKGKEIRIELNKQNFTIHSNSLIAGILFIILGYLIFSGKLIAFNNLVSTTPLQKWLFNLEEKILGFLR
ncbi:DUF255 domain-containing protein [Candidatus Pacearchaeota archaeon]|nr:MAG: DUF255 domain-containing protein [Candidatus Pacearchaeota archaeon]